MKIIKDFENIISLNHKTTKFYDENELPYSKGKILQALFTRYKLNKNQIEREKMKCLLLSFFPFYQKNIEMTGIDLSQKLGVYDSDPEQVRSIENIKQSLWIFII